MVLNTSPVKLTIAVGFDVGGDNLLSLPLLQENGLLVPVEGGQIPRFSLSLFNRQYQIYK